MILKKDEKDQMLEYCVVAQVQVSIAEAWFELATPVKDCATRPLSPLKEPTKN